VPTIERTASGESPGPRPRAGMKRAIRKQETTLRLPRRALCARRGDSICRTAVYVTRMPGGVGGRGREVPSYPD
jgi:hypothetical protein